MYDYMRVIRVSHAAVLDGLADALGRPWGPTDMEDGSWRNYERGRKVSGVDYAAARDRLHRFSREVIAWWSGGFDLLLTPTLATLPPPRGWLVEPEDRARRDRLGATIPYTPQWNVTGQPAISLPLALTDEGLPIGVQLVAGPGREDVLLRVAARLEEAAPWAGRRPAIWASPAAEAP
jgi:amidase